MTVAYIAIGSNLAFPPGAGQCCQSIRRYSRKPHSCCFFVYRTPPLGPQDQPDYLNAAVALETTLALKTIFNHAPTYRIPARSRP
ncbi:2-amino-4-hydroxy-6-hydroxymethyldihydropteridine diphosphokinase [Escherichia coli]